MIANSNSVRAGEFPGAAPAKPVDREQWHRFRIRTGYWIAALSLLALFIYGYDYYFASPVERALSVKHPYLKPSGAIGLRLGMFGFVLCLLVALYPLRKRWAWLGRQGLTRHWLDYHGLLGVLAPLVITFHASFKFGGFAGIAYWIMILVALSGLAGRYLYAQIPATLNVAELSLKAGQEESARLHEQLSSLGVLSVRDVELALHAPDVHRTEQLSLVAALGQMIVFDLLFPLRVRRLRRKLTTSDRLSAAGTGQARIERVDLERAISLAREAMQLKKKVVFLSKSQRLLHLWHVIHRPFSASFAVLVSIHVVLMLMLGFY